MYTAKFSVVVALLCALVALNRAAVVQASDADDQFNTAASHYSAQQWKLAAEEFRAFARENPDHSKHAKAMYYEGEALVQLGLSARAYPVFVDLLAEQPVGPYAKQALFRAGEAALLSGQHNEATVRLSQFRDLYPEDKLNSLVLLYQADLSMQAGDTASAIALYRESIKSFGDQASADQCRLGLAHALEAQKDKEGSQALLHEIAQRDHSPWTEMAVLELGDDAAAGGHNQQALELYDSIIQRFPSSPLLSQAQLGRGRALYQLGRYEDAQRDLTSVVSSKDKDLAIEARRLLAQAQKAQKQWNAAADTLSAALQNHAKHEINSLPTPSAETSATAADAPAPVVAAPVTSRNAVSTRNTEPKPFEELKSVAKIAPVPKPATNEPTPARAPESAVADNTPTESVPNSGAVSVEKHIDAAAAARAAAKLAAEKNAAFEEQQRRRAAVIRFQSAEAMVRAGDFRHAIGTLEMVDAASDDPPSLANRYLLAVALQGAKRNDEAMATLKDLSVAIDNKIATIATDRPDETAAPVNPLAADDLTALRSLRGNVLLAQATSLVAAEKFAGAIAPLQDYLAIGRQDVGAERASSALIVCFARTNRIEEARKMLADFSAKYPTSTMIVPATQQVADAAFNAGQYATAAEMYTSLTTEGNAPETIAKGLAGLGWSRAKLGDYETADKVLGQFLDRYPTDSSAVGVAMARGQALEHLGRDSAAATVYRQAMTRYHNSPQMPGLLAAAAHLHDRLGEDEEAIQTYQRIVHDYPNNPEIDAALYGWAWALRDMGHGNEADKIFRKIYEEHANSRFWADATYRLAERAGQHGDHAAAVELLQPLLTGECPAPVLQHALYLQAQIAIGDHHWAEAEPPLQRLVSEFPNGELTLAAEFWYAEIAYRTDDFLTAQKRFDALAAHVTNHGDRWTAIVPLRRAQLLMQQKQWSQARELGESIAKDYPDFDQQYEVDYLVGRCLMASNSFDDARTVFTKVIRSAAGGKTETAAMAQWQIGDSYFQQENYPDALREYMRVEILYPYPRWQAAALLQAGKCYEKLGKAHEAAELYARMIEKYPQTEFTADASQRFQDTTKK